MSTGKPGGNTAPAAKPKVDELKVRRAINKLVSEGKVERITINGEPGVRLIRPRAAASGGA